MRAVKPLGLLPPTSEGVPLDSELADRVGWLIRLRWFAGSLVLLGAISALGVGLGRPGLCAVGLGILGYNVWLAYTHRRLARGAGTRAPCWRLFVNAQIVLDWVALTSMCALTGGVESPVILLYSIHVILAALLLPRRDCLAQTTLGLALITLLALGGWPHDGLRFSNSPFAILRVYGYGPRVVTFLVVVAGLLYLWAILASSIAGHLRRREQELLDVKNRAEKMHAEMALLHEIAISVTETLDLDVVLQRVAEQAANITGAKACSIRLLSESGELYMSAAHGLSESYLRKGRVDLAHSTIDRKALQGEPVLVDDVGADGMLQYPDEVLREGIRSVLCVPLVVRDRVLGVVRVYREAPGAFHEEDVRFLQHFASLAAIAINNARACTVLQDLDRERCRFVRVVAHELRAPIAAILGNIAVVMGRFLGEIPERAGEMLKRSHRRGNLLLALVSDLLALVAVRDQTEHPPPEPVSLAEIARETIEDLASDAEARQIRLQVLADDSAGPLYANRDQMERLMANLIGNAVKYNREEGRVTVRVRGDERTLELVVEDTGIGIPLEAQDRIFEEFHRAENARKFTDEGTGLGLAICKRIVEDHGGQIALESEEGRGTRVMVIFPRDGVKAPLPEAGTPACTVPAPDKAGPV